MSGEQTALLMRLYVLDYGLFEVYGDRRIIGIPGYLIRAGDATILIDTGLPAWYADDPIAHAEADGVDFGRFLMLTRENLPEAQLARVGLTAADITHLVITHSHIDHIGGIGNFPLATIVIGREERALPKPLYWGGVSPIDWPTESRYELIDEDTDLVPGVRILSTPGHTPGHLSLLVRLPRTGPMVLTVDALSRPEELELDMFHAAWDERLVRESARRLVRIAEDEHAQLVYGHSPAQWPGLKKAPEFYD